MKVFKNYLLTAALSALMLTLFASLPAKAEANPFEAQNVVASADFDAEEAKKEGKCGEGKAKGKCGEGKCGEGKAKAKGKCGEGKAKAKGKCGEGKCGEGKAKSKESKCGE